MEPMMLEQSHAPVGVRRTEASASDETPKLGVARRRMRPTIFLVGAWTELRSGHSFVSKLMRFIFCGIRLLDEVEEGDDDHAVRRMPTVKESVNFSTHLSQLQVFSAFCAIGYIFQTHAELFQHCKEQGVYGLEVWKSLVSFFLAWLGPQIFVRLVAGPPRRPHPDQPVSWRSLLILENVVWIIFMAGDSVKRFLVFFFTEGDHIGAAGILEVTLHVYCIVQLFLVVAPCLAFGVVARKGIVCELLFSGTFGGLLGYCIYKIMQDVHCGPQEMRDLFEDLHVPARTTFDLQMFHHFMYTHRFCIILAVFLRMHVRVEDEEEDPHVLPDICMIMQLFRPLRQRYCSLISFVLLSATAIIAPTVSYLADCLVKLTQAKCGAEGAGPMARCLASVVNGLLLIHIVRMYCRSPLVQSSSSWESHLVVITGTAGMVYFFVQLEAAMKEFSQAPWKTGHTALSMVTHFSGTLMSADVFSHQLHMPASLDTTLFPLWYSLLNLVYRMNLEYAHASFYLEEGQGHGGGHGPKPSPGEPAGDHHRRLAGGGGGVSDAARGFETLGIFCLIEAALIQTIGWLVFYLEGTREWHHQHPELNRHSMVGVGTNASHRASEVRGSHLQISGHRHAGGHVWHATVADAPRASGVLTQSRKEPMTLEQWRSARLRVKAVIAMQRGNDERTLQPRPAGAVGPAVPARQRVSTRMSTTETGSFVGPMPAFPSMEMPPVDNLRSSW